MPHFVIEMLKTIVVEIEADSPEEAIELAMDNDEPWDGAWVAAEPVAILLETKP